VLPFFLLWLPVVDAGVSAPDAGVVIEEVRSQAWMLSECASEVDGGTENVSLDFRVFPDGGGGVRLVGEPSPLGRCARSLANGFQFPTDATIRRAQTFSISNDGGVQVLPFMGVGGLDKKDISAVIKSHHDAVKHCYEARLQSQRGLAGKLTVQWVIGSEGEVVEASAIVDTLADPLVGRCVIESVKTWRFPPPINGGKVNVTFPYIFVMKKEDDSGQQPAAQGDELMPIVPQRQGPQPSAN
jgi:hypothetical protein